MDDRAFRRYLSEIGMGMNLIQRVSDLHEDCEYLASPNEVVDIFVSDAMGEGGKRVYSWIHFFSKVAVFKIDRFDSNPAISVQPLSRVKSCGIYKGDYRRLNQPATENSGILQATVIWEPVPFVLSLTATGQNCNHLLRVLKTYLLPYLVDGQRQPA
jgi:hypothetical protein